MCQSTTILIYKKIVISTFKCQDIQVLLFPCFLLECMLGKQSIHPSQVQEGLCVFAWLWDRSNKKMQSGED
jgi:hypothetical protein